MKEQALHHAATSDQRAARLPEKARAFVQHAFAHGAAEKLDERKRWLLIRYVADDWQSFKKMKDFAGVKTAEGARTLYLRALRAIWNASSMQVKERFPEEAVVIGKRNHQYGREVTHETRAKISSSCRGRRFSEEHKAKLSAAHRGKAAPSPAVGMSGVRARGEQSILAGGRLPCKAEST